MFLEALISEARAALDAHDAEVRPALESAKDAERVANNEADLTAYAQTWAAADQRRLTFTDKVRKTLEQLEKDVKVLEDDGFPVAPVHKASPTALAQLQDNQKSLTLALERAVVDGPAVSGDFKLNEGNDKAAPAASGSTAAPSS